MSGFRTILVPLDGSSYAAQALAVAERFAGNHDSTVHLVLVHQPAPVWFSSPDLPEDMAAFDAAAWHREVEYLEGVARRFAADSGLSVKHRVLDGDVAPAIEEYTAAEGIDLVVMTSHGYGGLTRLWLGSTADKLIRRVNIPVLVVHPAPDGGVVPPRIRRILVPLDGSQFSASILGQARTMALANAAELVLAMIVEPLPPMMPPVPFPLGVPPVPEEMRLLEDQRYLDAVRNRLEDEGLQVEIRLRMGRKVARQIAELAAHERCDLIMMATHGAGGLDRLLLGSVTDQVLRRATVPVLVVPPAATAPVHETEDHAVETAGSAPGFFIG